MENLMTLRSVRTLALAAALGAACGGGDPPGGGNGDTDGGGTRDGTTDNGGRNPLIDAIPGCWEIVSINCELEDDSPVRVTVDPNDPDCDGDPIGTRPGGDPPGDACIDWISTHPRQFVLDGDVVRSEGEDNERADGHVLEDGHRIVYTYERLNDSDSEFPMGQYEIDTRWVQPLDPKNPDCTIQGFRNAEPRCTPEGGGAP